MVRKSYGKMRGSRLKLIAGRKLAITNYIKEFKVDEKVHVSLVPSSPFRHPRFHGKTGRVIEKRGNGYGVEMNDSGKMKMVFFRPEHLKAAG